MNRLVQRIRRHFSFQRPPTAYKPLVATVGEFLPHEMAEEEERELNKRELNKRSVFDVHNNYWADQLRSGEKYE